jgi:hypothetical protein
MIAIRERVQATPFIPTIALALAAAVVLPVLVHLAPASGSVPNGARWLPMYIAPLLLVLWNRPAAGLLVAGLAPAANHLLTGMPALPILPLVTAELLLFSAIAYGFVRLLPSVPLHAALGCVGAKALVLLFTGAAAGLLPALTIAWPGIVLLTVCNVLAVRHGH